MSAGQQERWPEQDRSSAEVAREWRLLLMRMVTERDAQLDRLEARHAALEKTVQAGQHRRAGRSQVVGQLLKLLAWLVTSGVALYAALR